MTNTRGYRVPTADDDADVPYWNDLLAGDVAKDVDKIEDRLDGMISPKAAAAVDELRYKWRNKYAQIVMGITAGNLLRLFRGLQIGGTKVQAVTSDNYIWGGRSATTGRLAENVLDRTGNVPQWVLDRWKNRMGLGGPGGSLVTKYTVKPDGTGDYLSPKLANDAFVEGPGKTCEITVHPGTYTETEWKVKEGVTIRGTIRDACILAGSLPDTATDTQISNTSTLWLLKTARLENLTITARNMRYAVHSEASGAAPDARHDVVNCHIEHYGNQGVKDYRAANGIAAGSVWGSDRAWGYGSSSGIYERFENVTFVSRRESWYVHDNKDFLKPTNHDLIGCRILGRDADSFISIQSLGSGQSSRVNIYGSEVASAYVYDTDYPWITEDPAKQVAQHSQIAVTIDGKTPIGYRSTNSGKAIRIDSSSTGAVSTVRISGTAAAAVFGAGTYKDGGGGLKGYAYGYWDISGILVGLAANITVANTLGRRLGDCSSSPKTLTITIDGGSPIDVVFNANHTADTNATILAKINTALGAAGTASEYAVTQGETYPRFPDRQATVQNTGTAGIPRFGAVKAATGPAVEILGLADPASSLAGIALEPIPPGKYGRILTSGLLYSSQIPGFTNTINPGTAIYLSDATPGTFANAGTRKVLTGYITGWARF